MHVLPPGKLSPGKLTPGKLSYIYTCIHIYMYLYACIDPRYLVQMIPIDTRYVYIYRYIYIYRYPIYTIIPDIYRYPIYIYIYIYI